MSVVPGMRTNIGLQEAAKARRIEGESFSLSHAQNV